MTQLEDEFATSYRPRYRLPVALTPLIGREQLVDAVQQLLHRIEVRLVTLTGVGGVGKTRLALQVATDLREDFMGVFFVPLASISNPALVSSAIARVLGLEERGDRSILELLQEYLCSKQFLLVLDNFEQVVPAASLIWELLTTCPALKVLVTSRAVLHLSGEHEFAVPPLRLPHLEILPSLDSLAQTPAVALCLERIRSVQPNFQLTEANAPVVAEICVQVDGLPLAIELAAARIKMFPPPVLLARLKHRLELLTGGAQDLPTRQQTLRNTLQWSYDLLTSDEQRLFRRWAVFAHGCTLEAAEVVCNREGENSAEMLDRVGYLLDKSLLHQGEQEGSEPRFVMVETIREYGLERLAQSEEDLIIHTAHASYYLALAEEGESALYGPQQDLWLKRLEVEHDNLCSALRWSLEQRKTPLALRLGSALAWFWYLHGYLSEGRSFLGEALAGTDELGCTRERAKALSSAGELAQFQGDFAVARLRLEESLVLWQQLGDKERCAYTLTTLGKVSKQQGDLGLACALQRESVALFREIDDKRGLALSLFGLAEVILAEGDYGTARCFLEESLKLWREVADKWGLALVLNGLGEVMRCQGDYEHAAVFYDGSLTIFRKLKNKWSIAVLLHNLAYVAQFRGDDRQMAELLKESKILFQELGHKGGIAACVAGWASLAGILGQWELAIQLSSATQALFETIGARLDPADRTAYERNLAAVRTQLSEATFMVAWIRGQTLTWEQISIALEQVTAQHVLPTSQLASRPTSPLALPPKADTAGLTAREGEVLYFLTLGLTYAQIAEKLIISTRTVDAHLRSIYSKLGVTSRNEATRYALAHQLV